MANQQNKPQKQQPGKGVSGKDDGDETRKMAPQGDEPSEKRGNDRRLDDDDEEVKRTRPADETDRGGMRTPGAGEESERRQTLSDDGQTNR